jgi:hypothetical protein
MRSLRVDLGSGGRCELYYRTDYRGLSTGKDAFMRASLLDLAAVRGDSPARRDALQFIMYHRLGTDTDDPAAVLKNAVRSGEVIAATEQRRSSGAGSRGSNEPTPRSITFSPSQLFRGAARMAGSVGASPPALPRLAAEDGIAIWLAKPGDVLPDGTIATPVATPLTDAQPFEYTPDAVSGDIDKLAASTNSPKFAAKMLGYDYKTFGTMLHKFKDANGLGPADNSIFHDNGDVEFNGRIFEDSIHDYAP